MGQIYNIGGTNEIPNIEVARHLIRCMGMEDRMESLITFVPDRVFNDLRYTIDTSKVLALGWKEEVTFEEGLRQTVEVR